MTNQPTYENYATRYRPRKIGDIRGQPKVVNVIAGMFQTGNIVRAMLVSGPTGTGKTTIGRVIAAHLNCAQPAPVEGYTVGNPCGACPSCLAISRGEAPDVHEVDCAVTRGIDDIKTLVGNARYAPRTNYRIFLLDEVHQLSKDAMKALLKVLEEPPARTIFILLTTEPSSIPPEIKGRLLQLRLKLLDDEAQRKLLRRAVKGEGIPQEQVSDALIQSIIDNAGGHARNALFLLEAIVNAGLSVSAADVGGIAEQVIGQSPYRLAAKWVRAVFAVNGAEAFEAAKAVAEPAPFLDGVVKTLEQITRCAYGQHDKYDTAAVEIYNKHVKSTPHLLSVMATALDDALYAVKQVRQMLPASPVLTALTAKALSNIAR